jgi:hypothetical protein
MLQAIAISPLQKLCYATLWALICLCQIAAAQTPATTQCQALVKLSQANKAQKTQIETFQLVILTMVDGSVALQVRGNTSLSFAYVQPQSATNGKQASLMKTTIQKNAWDFQYTQPNLAQVHLQINPISGALQYTQTSKDGAEVIRIDGSCELPLLGKETFIRAHASS